MEPTTTLTTTTALNISLEPHLLEVLEPLPPLLPPALSDQVKVKLQSLSESDMPRTIPYALLLSISQWSRTSSGRSALASHSPVLKVHSYTMISLLAGTKTSPERKFPAYVPKEDVQEIERKRAMNDKKALTALINALLSIGGSGIASWWASERLSWRNEWKILLSLFVAVVVAISEAILYLIWSSRKSRNISHAAAARRTRAAINKKDIGDNTSNMLDASVSENLINTNTPPGLRQRAVVFAAAEEIDE